jgi:hypothetical protein
MSDVTEPGESVDDGVDVTDTLGEDQTGSPSRTQVPHSPISTASGTA